MAQDARVPAGQVGEPSGDRRRCERYCANAPARLQVTGTARHARSRVADIAERGISVRARSAIPEGTRVMLELEVIMPTRLHLGFDLSALVIDGPPASFFARVPATVVRSRPLADGSWELGMEFATEECGSDDLQIVDLYLDHLREGFEDELV